MIGFGQDVRNLSNSDLIINHLLENTIPFIKDKNSSKPNFRLYLTTNESTVNWKQERLSKWQILDKKPKTLKQ